jgi:pilus assembly protein CpaD
MTQYDHFPVARRLSRRAVRPATALVLGSCLVLGLAGCRGHTDGRMVGFQAPQSSVEERHPITVGKDTTEIELHVVAGHGLNGGQMAQIHNFVGLWRNEGIGQIMIGSSGAGATAVNDIREYMASVDVPKAAIRLLPGGGGQRTVKISFLRYVATGPDCGRFATNLAENKKNENYDNFGCARQHNFAAMIANPRDLLMPRTSNDEREGARRDTIFQKYIGGEGTGAVKTADEKAGTISDVGK